MTPDDLIQASPTAKDALARAFDFDPDRRELDRALIERSSLGAAASSLRVVAGTGSGGLYLMGPTEGEILFVSSEGSAYRFAPSLGEAVAMVLAVPEWEHCVQRAGGDPDALRQLAADLQGQCFDEDADVDAERATIRAELDLPDLADAPSSLLGWVKVI